jgi:hypothetical protein
LRFIATRIYLSLRVRVGLTAQLELTCFLVGGIAHGAMRGSDSYPLAAPRRSIAAKSQTGESSLRRSH